jgi:hypothetical protein
MRAVLQRCRAYGAGKKRDAMKATAPPLARGVLVLMGFSMNGVTLTGFF